jgi:hypothetical protein
MYKDHPVPLLCTLLYRLIDTEYPIMATRLDLSHAQWELAHVEVAYTNLNQIAYLLNKAGISPEIYTQHPVNASKQLTLNNLKQYIVSDNMSNTGTVSAGGSWEAHAGRCSASKQQRG